MRNLTKRIAPFFLALVMCLSLACGAAAAPVPSSDTPESVTTTQENKLNTGRTKYLITGAVVLVVGGGFYAFLNQKTKSRKKKN